MIERPLPETDDDEFAPYWHATRQGALVVQQCSRCQRLRWPTRPACSDCHHLGFDWEEVPRTGTLHSWIVVEHQTMEFFPTPYVVGLVDVDTEQTIRFLGNIVECDPEKLVIGMSLEATFSPMSERVTLVHWAPRYSS